MRVTLAIDRVVEFSQQFDQLIEVAMNLADNIERPVLGFLLVPKRLTLDRDGIDFFWTREFEDVTDPGTCFTLWS
jgi:hypothetical protein